MLIGAIAKILETRDFPYKQLFVLHLHHQEYMCYPLPHPFKIFTKIEFWPNHKE
jgi:hypothetical protein